MVPRSDAVAALGEDGASARGVHPVFRSEDGSLVVVLPEVRVEGSDPERLAALGRSLHHRARHRPDGGAAHPGARQRTRARTR